MEKKVLTISDLIKLPKEYVNEHIMPSRGNHITKDFDLHNSWKYCQNYYGPDFNFQLININRDIHNVWLPDLSLCKHIWMKYFTEGDDYDLFKLIWVLNDYISDGWKYPVQAVYNWKMDWIEIHPGFLRGLVYNILNVKKFQAWYQPMTNKEFDCIEKFFDPNTIISKYNDHHHIDGELITYFDRPMIKLCIHISNIEDSVKEFKKRFYQNLGMGINIVGPVISELESWPDNDIKNKLFFDRTNLPTIHVKDIEDLYVQLLFVGTDKFNNQTI